MALISAAARFLSGTGGRAGARACSARIVHRSQLVFPHRLILQHGSRASRFGQQRIGDDRRRHRRQASQERQAEIRCVRLCHRVNQQLARRCFEYPDRSLPTPVRFYCRASAYCAQCSNAAAVEGRAVEKATQSSAYSKARFCRRRPKASLVWL